LQSDACCDAEEAPGKGPAGLGQAGLPDRLMRGAILYRRIDSQLKTLKKIQKYTEGCIDSNLFMKNPSVCAGSVTPSIITGRKE
jgi:hypothetical protein